MSWKSEDEINKAYIDHVITLHEAGIEHDPKEIADSWESEIKDFRESQTQ